MPELDVKLTHEGVTYEAQVMTIKRTTLGWEDHGIFTAVLHCESPGSGQGIGTYCLDETGGMGKPRKGTAYGLDHIMRIIETVGVRNWEDLTNKRILVLRTPEENRSGWGASGIADIDGQRVFIFKDHAESFFPDTSKDPDPDAIKESGE